MKKQETVFGIAMYRIFLMLVSGFIFFIPSITVLNDISSSKEISANYSFLIMYIIWIIYNMSVKTSKKKIITLTLINFLLLLLPTLINFLLLSNYSKVSFIFAICAFICNLIIIFLYILEYKKEKNKILIQEDEDLEESDRFRWSKLCSALLFFIFLIGITILIPILLILMLLKYFNL